MCTAIVWNKTWKWKNIEENNSKQNKNTLSFSQFSIESSTFMKFFFYIFCCCEINKLNTGRTKDFLKHKGIIDNKKLISILNLLTACFFKLKLF